MVELVFLIPLLTGAAAFFLPAASGRLLLVMTGAVHLAVSCFIWIRRPDPFWADYFALTPEGLLSLMVISFLFFLIAIYTGPYLKASGVHSEKIFLGSMLLFLSTMTLVTLSDHVMVMWIAIEATTLASAPLIYTHRTAAAIEATWKYVLICSVGIAMALLGSVLVSVAMDVKGINAPVAFSALTAVAGKLDPFWLKAGFIFILVGYGTKMGLAPMHTWLPDAHSEAPSPASALLSGVLLNCAYLGIFKTNKVMIAAGLGDFSGATLMVFGLLSIVAAATFIIKQNEYKRMLAYSSIENMGIIAFGTGVGGMGAYGAMLCLIHHSLIKSSLFLASGNILLGYGTGLINKTGLLIRRMPKTFAAFFGGFAGIAGFPPFGIFIGEVFILMAAFRAGHFVGAGLMMLCLCVIFAGFAGHLMNMSFTGRSDDVSDGREEAMRMGESAVMVWPSYILLIVSVGLCLFTPDLLYRTIVSAVTAIGGGM